ncbi:MAG: hypothetical protein RL470_1037, partial [Actinomycetota bacterium]
MSARVSMTVNSLPIRMGLTFTRTQGLPPYIS